MCKSPLILVVIFDGPITTRDKRFNMGMVPKTQNVPSQREVTERKRKLLSWKTNSRKHLTIKTTFVYQWISYVSLTSNTKFDLFLDVLTCDHVDNKFWVYEFYDHVCKRA